MHVVNITQKGQVTIPASMREQVGLFPGRKAVFIQEENGVKIRPAVDFFSLKGFIKTRRRATIEQEEKAAEEYVVREYLRKERRIRSQ